MGNLGYNTGVNLIKSSGALERTHYPFSTDVKGIDTMQHSIPNQPALKVCSKCGESKPLIEYSKDKRRKDGLSSYCKSCASAKYQKYYQSHAEYLRARASRYWYENTERKKEYNRTYYRQHRDQEEWRVKMTAKSYAYREQNRDKVRQHLLDSQKRRGARNDKTRARTTVNRAIRRGELPPAWSMVCDLCQEAQANHWHHHNGYSREHWLDVTAVCYECHGKDRRTS